MLRYSKKHHSLMSLSFGQEYFVKRGELHCSFQSITITSFVSRHTIQLQLLIGSFGVSLSRWLLLSRRRKWGRDHWMMSDVIFRFCKVVALFVDPTIKSKGAADVMWWGIVVASTKKRILKNTRRSAKSIRGPEIHYETISWETLTLLWKGSSLSAGVGCNC